MRLPPDLASCARHKDATKDHNQIVKEQNTERRLLTSPSLRRKPTGVTFPKTCPLFVCVLRVCHPSKFNLWAVHTPCQSHPFRSFLGRLSSRANFHSIGRPAPGKPARFDFLGGLSLLPAAISHCPFSFDPSADRAPRGDIDPFLPPGRSGHPST